jgi:hypothetical protein
MRNYLKKLTLGAKKKAEFSAFAELSAKSMNCRYGFGLLA